MDVGILYLPCIYFFPQSHSFHVFYVRILYFEVSIPDATRDFFLLPLSEMPPSKCRVVPSHCRRTPANRLSKREDRRCVKDSRNGVKIRSFVSPRACVKSIVKLQAAVRGAKGRKGVVAVQKIRSSNAAKKIQRAVRSRTSSMGRGKRQKKESLRLKALRGE